jgi:hypothetical protein
MTNMRGGGDSAHDRRVVDVETFGDVSQAFAMDMPSPNNPADLVGSVGRTSGSDPKHKSGLRPLCASCRDPGLANQLPI